MWHINETWHALNSTFPDTNCIVCFQINPHWISNSGFWKVVLEIFQNGLENWRRESCFIRIMLLHRSLWLQWLLCVTLALNWLITLHILLIWHHLTIFCSLIWKRNWLRRSIQIQTHTYTPHMHTNTHVWELCKNYKPSVYISTEV